MKIFSAVLLLAIGTAIVGMAAGPLPSAPEIDPATSGSAFAVLAGALVILLGRRKR